MSVGPHWNNQAPLQNSFGERYFKAAGPPHAPLGFMGSSEYRDYVRLRQSSERGADLADDVWRNIMKRGDGHRQTASSMAGDVHDGHSQGLQSGGSVSYLRKAGLGSGVDYDAPLSKEEKEGLRQLGEFNDESSKLGFIIPMEVLIKARRDTEKRRRERGLQYEYPRHV